MCLLWPILYPLAVSYFPNNRVDYSLNHDVRQRYLVSGAMRRSNGVYVRLVTQAPPNPSARPLAPTLEDAYLYRLSLCRKEGNG